MSIGKLVSGFLITEEHFYIHILDEQQTSEAMRNQPPGYAIIRIEKKNGTTYKPIVSFKFKKIVVHHPIEEISVKVSATSGSLVKCKVTNHKNFRFLRKINTDFLSTIRLFVTEIINNNNYLENLDENSIANELLYRKFIIYAEGQQIVIKRRLENDIIFATIGINIREMSFFAEMNGEHIPVLSFNHFLISEFLQIDISDKLLVRHALGYQRDVDLYTGKARDLCTLLSSSSPSTPDNENSNKGPITKPTDKESIIKRLKHAIGGEEATKIPHWKAPPKEVRSLLIRILDSVVLLQSLDDKMDWINRGILDIIFQILLRNIDESHNSIPIKIAKNLLQANLEGCRIFGQYFILLFSSNSADLECVSIYQAIYVLLSVDLFRKLFIDNFGMTRLMDTYNKMSILLLGDQVNPFGDIINNDEEDDQHSNSISSPILSEEEWIEDSDDDEDDDDDSDEDDLIQSAKLDTNDNNHHSKEDERHKQQLKSSFAILSPKGNSLIIPKLVLPSQKDKKNSRKENFSLNNKTEAEFKRSAREELTSLATNLGETYMTGNLTALLSYLQNDSEVKARKEQVKLSSRAKSNSSHDESLFKRLLQFRRSCYYKIKCWILRIFARVTEKWETLQLLPSPINLLFSEVLVANKDCLLARDEEFRSLLYKILSNFAFYYEYCHCIRWNELTNQMSSKQIQLYRRKLDKFLWRIRNRLSSAIEAREYHETETQLTILYHYMEQCPTKIMSLQVSHMFMESLLTLKDVVFQRGRITHQNMEFLIIIHRIMQIFDQIIIQNHSHDPLDDFLISILIKHKETWRYFRHYACQLLFSKSIERNYQTSSKIVMQYIHGNISTFKQQIIFHILCNVKLIKRKKLYYENKMKEIKDEIKTLKSSSLTSSPSSNNTSTTNLFKKQQQDQKMDTLNNNNTHDKSSPKCDHLDTTHLLHDDVYGNLEIKKKQKENLKCEFNRIVDYLYYFEFLLHPTKGYLLKILADVKGTTHRFELQKVILKLLIEVFSIEDSMYIKSKSYIDYYISYAYLGFLKLYHNTQEDHSTLELINLHLQLLLTFSLNKNKNIILKFYQLRAVDFLVQQINLEYEIKRNVHTQSTYTLMNDKIDISAPSALPVPFTLSSPSTSTSKSTTPTNKRNTRSKSLSMKPSKLKHKIHLALHESEGQNKITKAMTKQHRKSSSFHSDHKNNKTPNPLKKHKSLTNKVTNTSTSSKKGLPFDLSLSDSPAHSPNLNKTRQTQDTSPHVTIFAPDSPAQVLPFIHDDLPSTSTSDDDYDYSASSSSFNDYKKMPTESSSLHSEESIEIFDTDSSENSSCLITFGTSSSSFENSDDDDDDDDDFLSTSSEFTSETTSSDDDDDNNNKPQKLILKKKSKSVESVKSAIVIPKLTHFPIKGGSPVSAESKPIMKIQSSTEIPQKRISTPPFPSRISTNRAKSMQNQLLISSPSSKSNKKESEKKSKKTKQSPNKTKPIIPSLSNCPIKGENSNAQISTHKRESSEIGYDVPTGNLSKIEKTINTEDPKWQLVFEKIKNDKDQTDKTSNDHHSINPDVEEVQFLYNQERNNRKIYNTQNIHISIIKLLLTLMITTNETLEPLYSDRFPLDNKQLNIPFLLREHLSHNANQNIIPQLVDETLLMGDRYFRLLKLLCVKLFKKENYKLLDKIAVGAYGTVYNCKLSNLMYDDNNNVQSNKDHDKSFSLACKLMKIPESIHDRCVLHDIFDEILILDKFKEDSRISHMFDYGTDDEYYWIIMKKYKCSLKNWRQKQKQSLNKNLTLYLNIYMNILNTFQFLLEKSVNHYDIKCDNFLIHPLNDDIENWNEDDENHFWDPISDVPNFSVCLADFGEAIFFSNEIESYTTRNRGTEFNKSPEMLAVAYASQKTRSTYDRRKKVGASSPSDIWSLGCLLYELLTGEFLFYDQDWVHFFIRVTSQGQELLPPEKMEKIDNNPLLREFLLFVLCRDPRMRPSIADVIQRFKYVRGLLSTNFTDYCPRIPTPRGFTSSSDVQTRIQFYSSVNRNNSSSTIQNVVKNDQQASNNPESPEQKEQEKQESSVIEKRKPLPIDRAKFSALSPKSGSDPNFNATLKSLQNSSSGENDSKPNLKLDFQKHLSVPAIDCSIIKENSDSSSTADEVETIQLPPYFINTTTKILDYLLISAADVIPHRDYLKKLGITHLINCTNEQNTYSIEFFSLKVSLETYVPNSLISSIDSIVSFIEDAKNHHGKVLVYSGNGRKRSAIVTIAYLMESKGWSYYESYIFVQNRRYIIEPNMKFIHELCTYKKTQKQNAHQKFQCICGACSFSVTKAFSQEYFQNPKACSCTFNNPNSFCPNIGCFEFLQEMRKCFKYPADEVMWGFTMSSFLHGDFEKTHKFIPSKTIPKKFSIPKNWQVYKCASCDFITHAFRNTSATVETSSRNSLQNNNNFISLSHFDAVVVTSIPVDHTKQLME